ncbi:MAG: PD-(D/E)XK nuclease domain-containing protein [Clostridium sp.]|nr:PD-(D/E)XK nuclease domain-containing protein [Clostridium sp.]
MIGYDARAEYHTSEGSIDMVIPAGNYLYVIELKINGEAKDAMRQIETKRYAAQFDNNGRQVIKIGIGFARKSHTIDTYEIRRG